MWHVRAAVLEAVGQPLRVMELQLDPPRAGEVTVRILASGVCHSDVHRADGDWGDVPPTVLGHEGAGLVEETGDGVQGLPPGQLVVLNWYYPCLACPACTGGRQWVCTGTRAGDHLQQDGTTRLRTQAGGDVLAYLSIGTFAEREVVPAQAAITIPAEVPPRVAALIGCCVTTGVGAVTNTARIPAGASVAVIGLGGVGLSAVMGAVLSRAAPIIAVDRAPEKLEIALKMGATATVLATEDVEETLRDISAATGGGPGFAIEAVGHPATADLAIRCLPMGGTAVLVGIPRFGDRSSFEIREVVESSQRIIGSNYGSAVPAVDFPRLARLYLEGRLPIDLLIEKTISLDDVNGALDALRRGEGARRVIVFD